MHRDTVVRTALALSAPYNLAGAYLFAFPASTLSQAQGLPADAPALYRALTALLLALFGAAYAWLAAQKEISRPLLALGAIGKALAFLTFVLLALMGLCSRRFAAASVGDAILATIFGWWLLASRFR
jgi:hypothetical protein